MKKIGIVSLVALASAALSGCGEEQVETKEYYMTHDVERTEKLAWCNESLDNKMTQNCLNAHGAKEKQDLDLLWGDGIPMDDDKD
jgi:hypothetical protein